ncbi:hypothetical protein, partial [Bacillus sp. 03113]|uniref:hypothetical protein n=1 Tax=Bacillus sp. 03113 TaxID=2578211 RepID=UPI001144E706
MPTITIKFPLFEPTKTKSTMYETMQIDFSDSCNEVLKLKKENTKLTKSCIDKQLAHFQLPSTLIQEARKLALSR